MAHPGVACPVCGWADAPYPSEAVTMCDECGASMPRTAPRLLLVDATSYRTFCCAECLRRRLSTIGAYKRRGTSPSRRA